MERTEMNAKQGQRDFRGSAVSEEEAIRELYKNFSEAIKAQDIDQLMAFYAPEVVAFDIVPPLQVVGKEEYQKSWERFLPEMKTIETHDVTELKIMANEDVGFAHGLIHMVGTMKNGEKMDSWMRLTNGFCKIGGRWLVAHEQISVPADMESGKALWDLKPENFQHN
jgi:uncharacterized protein (TIGR02246 family)